MLTATQKQTCVDKAEFVLTEIQRIQELLNKTQNFKEIFGGGPGAMFEFMAKIKHEETGREFSCGQKALGVFQEVAALVLANEPDVVDFDPSEVTDRLRETFLSYVFTDLEAPLDSYVKQWIAEAIVYTSRRHRRYTHYMPCVALQIGNEDTYRFGPIEFSRKNSVRTRAVESLQRYEDARERLSNRARLKAAPGLQWCWERAAERSPKEPAEAFDRLAEGVEWIAIVSVPRCAGSVSEARAEAALRLALCGMSLLLPKREGPGLRLKDDPAEPHQRNMLSSVGRAAKFRPSSSWKFGTPKVEDGWREHIESKAKDVLTVLEHLVVQALDGRPLSFGFQIAQRAITWYADAVREMNVETKLVKCATAIECLLLAAPRKTTATFVIRGALLAQRQQQPMSHWAPIAKRLYQRRSDTVHGNIDSLNAATKESSAEAMEFTRNVVLQFLQFCHVLQPLGARRVGTKDDFLELYRETEGSFESEIREIVKEHGFGWEIASPPTTSSSPSEKRA
jgi:Apea-like HEPN